MKKFLKLLKINGGRQILAAMLVNLLIFTSLTPLAADDSTADTEAQIRTLDDLSSLKSMMTVNSADSGPTGSSSAQYLVKKGVKTLIIEKRKLPRFKCCSGLYSKKSIDFIQDHFGRIPEQMYFKNKSQMIKTSNNGIKYYIVPDRVYNNLKRDELDFWLLNTSNVKFYKKCEFIHCEESRDIIHVQCLYKGNEIRFQCKYLIGADGAFSGLRRQFDKLKFRRQKFSGSMRSRPL